VLSPFRGAGIAYLSDQYSYAGWSFYTPVRATQERNRERGLYESKGMKNRKVEKEKLCCYFV